MLGQTAGKYDRVCHAGFGSQLFQLGAMSAITHKQKTNIRPLDGLDLVRQLRGVRYHWKESGIPDVGLIAEEVGTVVPEVVTYAPNGEDAESVNYAKLVALLIEAVKTQQAQIEADRARLSALAARLDALEQSTAGPDVHGAGAQN